MNDTRQREPLARRWKRRAISIPATIVLSVVYLTLFVPVLAAARISDVVLALRGRRSGHARALLALATLVVGECAALFALGATWVLSLGRIALMEPMTFWIQHAWASFLFAGLVRIFSLRVEQQGAELVAKAPYVVFARHTSIFDTIVPIVLISKPHGIRLRYVMKQELLWDPAIDVGCNRLTNRFVARGSSDPAAQIRMVTELGEQLPERSIVVIYPEGTRYTPEKHAHAIERLERTNAELAALGRKMSRVLPPRPGGPLALLAQGHDVVIMAHSGFDGITGWRDIWRGDLIGRTVRVRYSRYAASELPADPGDRARWLFERWVELDAWVREVEVDRDPA